MAKDPAFNFYTGDWLKGTMGMTLTQKGAYMELLMLQFSIGAFTEEQANNVLMQPGLWDSVKGKFINGPFTVKMYEAKWDKKEAAVWDRLMDIHEANPKGLFWNVRLSFEKHKRKIYSESRRKNRHTTKDMTSHMTKDVSSHMSSHMENENENENNKEKGKVFRVPTKIEVWDYLSEYTNEGTLYPSDHVETFMDFYESKGWMVGKNKMKDWKAAARRSLKWDKKSKEVDWQEVDGLMSEVLKTKRT